MNTIRIFIGSSSELEQERAEFRDFLSVENDRLHKRDVYLELVQWEHFLDSVSHTRLQNEYNVELTKCDIVICLFFTKAGKYTQEEFDTALRQFRETGKPLIYTYFKTGATESDSDLMKFKKRLANIGHFYTSYKGIEDLKYQFRKQLDRLEDRGFIAVRNEVKKATEKAVTNYLNVKNAVISSTITAGGNVVIGDRTINTESATSRRLRLFLYLFVPLLAIAAAILWYHYEQMQQPLSLKVRVENRTPNPELPEPVSTLSLAYGPKTETKERITTDALFEGIPPNFRGQNVRIRFSAGGFFPLDTTLLLGGDAVVLGVRRNEDRAKLRGFISDEQGKPLDEVDVSISCCRTLTDPLGSFVLAIPFEHQRLEQRLLVFKKGYRQRDLTVPVIPGEPVRLILEKE